MIRTYARQAGFIALLLLAATLPFEMEAPWLRLGPLVLTNVEIVLAGALALAALAGPAPDSPRLPRLWLALALWFIAGLFISAWLAPEFRGNALKATLRTVQGMLLAPAVLWLAPTKRRGRGVVVALLVGGMAAAAIGLTEHLAGNDFPWLTVFRREATFAGPFLRLSGSFDYANQAAMFFEATLPFLFALTVMAAHARRWPSVAIGLLALVLYAQAIVLTFSRTGFISLLLVSAFIALLLFLRRDDRRLSAAWAGLAVGIAALVGVNWLVSPYFRLRLQSDVDTEWYRSAIAAPNELNMTAGEVREIPVTVTNRGALPWEEAGANPFRLGVRWQTADGRGELAERPLWPLPHTVAPEETVTLQVSLRAPRGGGDYHLIWDMNHENVNWFDARGDVQTITLVTVEGGDELASETDDDLSPEEFTEPLAFDAPLPGRRDLWTIAVRLIGKHPLTGIGLDNYRLTYSRYLTDDPMPDTALDQTVHSNNWYLETIVSVGVFGALPFLVWMLLLTWSIIQALRRPRLAPLPIAAGAGLLIFFVHGLLDYFLLFNATATLFWIITGLWLIFNDDHSRI
jgi:O-antigen ligase